MRSSKVPSGPARPGRGWPGGGREGTGRCRRARAAGRTACRRTRPCGAGSGQPGVHIGLCVVEPAAGGQREPLGEAADGVLAGEADVGAAQTGAAVQPDLAGTGDQDVGRVRVAQQRLQSAGTGELVAERAKRGQQVGVAEHAACLACGRRRRRGRAWCRCRRWQAVGGPVRSGRCVMTPPPCGGCTGRRARLRRGGERPVSRGRRPRVPVCWPVRVRRRTATSSGRPTAWATSSARRPPGAGPRTSARSWTPLSSTMPPCDAPRRTRGPRPARRARPGRRGRGRAAGSSDVRGAGRRRRCRPPGGRLGGPRRWRPVRGRGRPGRRRPWRAGRRPWCDRAARNATRPPVPGRPGRAVPASAGRTSASAPSTRSRPPPSGSPSTSRALYPRKRGDAPRRGEHRRARSASSAEDGDNPAGRRRRPVGGVGEALSSQDSPAGKESTFSAPMARACCHTSGGGSPEHSTTMPDLRGRWDPKHANTAGPSSRTSGASPHRRRAATMSAARSSSQPATAASCRAWSRSGSSLRTASGRSVSMVCPLCGRRCVAGHHGSEIRGGPPPVWINLWTTP